MQGRRNAPLLCALCAPGAPSSPQPAHVRVALRARLDGAPPGPQNWTSLAQPGLLARKGDHGVTNGKNDRTAQIRAGGKTAKKGDRVARDRDSGRDVGHRDSHTAGDLLVECGSNRTRVRSTVHDNAYDPALVPQG
ncbi:hypothetical protein C4L39_26315 [Clostridium diolis]|nr:hypothetical protein C4L39_26315 [Clostridium diolis]